MKQIPLMRVWFALILIVSGSGRIAAQTTAFTYQGRLNTGGNPATGTYDLRFNLYDAGTGGLLLAGPITNASMAISGGLFTVNLDFGAAVFNGPDRWLEVAVRTNNAATAFVALAPRSRLTPAPYAITAGNLAGVAGTNLAQLTVPNTAQQATGTPVITSGFITSANVTFGGSGYSTAPQVTVVDITGSGAQVNATVNNGVVTALNVALAGANYSTGARLVIAPPPSNSRQTFGSSNYFAGPSFLTNVNNVLVGDGSGLQNLNAWRLTGNPGTTPGTSFLGTSDNQPLEMKVNGSRALRLEPNAISPNLLGGFVGNLASNAVVGSVIGGGGTTGFTNRVGGNYNVVAGGYANVTYGGSATIAGGDNNLVANDRATVGGGYNNRATGRLSTIVGGDSNVASNTFATVAGGSLNVAGGAYSFAAGQRAKAIHQGAFVWADSQLADLTSSANNQFLIRAGGGVGVGTTNPAGALHLSGPTNVPPAPANVLPLDYGLVLGSAGGNSYSWVQSYGGSLALNPVAGGVAIGTNSAADVTLNLGGNTRLNKYDIYLREGTIRTSGLGWRAAQDGPFIYGWQGGSLGTSGPETSSLTWDYLGNVQVVNSLTVDQNGANTGTFAPGLNFGGGGEGISSQRVDGGNNKFGLDFYTDYSPRLSIANNGNVGIGTTSPANPLDVQVAVNQTIQFRSDGGSVPGIRIKSLGGNAGIMRFRNELQIWPSDDSVRAGRLDVRGTNGSAVITLNGSSGQVSATSFSPSSDRNLKEHFAPVDPQAVLSKLCGLSVQEWNFKSDEGARHVGPMAQDFYAAFGLGPDDRHITTVDADGIAFAAIQGLNQKLAAKDAEISALQARLAALEKLVQQALPEAKSAGDKAR